MESVDVRRVRNNRLLKMPKSSHVGTGDEAGKEVKYFPMAAMLSHGKAVSSCVFSCRCAVHAENNVYWTLHSRKCFILDIAVISGTETAGTARENVIGFKNDVFSARYKTKNACRAGADHLPRLNQAIEE